jgi:hypothetical protein
MYQDPVFWRGKATQFREIADSSDSDVLAEALRSRADEFDELAARIDAGGAASASGPRPRDPEIHREG